jgi:hypothetical protein
MFRKITDHKWKEVTLSWRKSHTALLTESYLDDKIKADERGCAHSSYGRK